ncbi:MAG TPA: FecR domain-containing protein [Longimicrobiales bacterium]|nr:FecR domain-containing protein [Longimicrobiales bacterium]
MEEIIGRVIRGEATESEMAELLAWRRESPRNERYYCELAWMLEQSRDLVWEAVADVPVPAVEEIVRRSSVGTNTGQEPGRLRRIWSDARFRGTLALAAGIAGIVFISQWFSGPVADAFRFGTGEIVTGPTEMSTVTLGDGTVVRLAPDSRLRISDKADTREVWLDGRAFFAVRKHAGLPFVVRSHAGDAVVLGTRFDLQATPAGLRVLVVEGAVQLSGRADDSERLEVTARQVGLVAPNSPPVVENADPMLFERELQWLGDFLVFEDTPLGQVAEEISRHFGIRVQILDSSLVEETVRGLFVKEGPAEVVQILCRALGVHCSVTESEVLIGP